MARRYLFGPVTPAFADQRLYRQRQAGDCLCFDAAGTTDLAIRPTDSWADVCARLPQGWQPDFVVLYLPYTTIPRGLWSAPVPLVGLAGDWNLQWHWYRHCLPRCDLILTDPAGVEVCARAGIAHARPATLFGCERGLLENAALPFSSAGVRESRTDWQSVLPPAAAIAPKNGREENAPPEGPRDLDVLFVGNLHPAVERERLAWLGRLARLGERWRVLIRTGVFGTAYHDLLRRARIVFNRSLHGECNQRAFEAAACGALLFQEAENREVANYFRAGRDVVSYTENNLEALLEHYLTHEDERRTIAAAARERVRTCGFADLWDGMRGVIDQEWPALVEHGRCRPVVSERDALLGRTWQHLGSVQAADPELPLALAAGLLHQPGAAALHHALGLVSARIEATRPVDRATLEQAAGYFRRALTHEPGHLLAGLNLAEALMGLGQKQAARDQACATLAVLDALPVPGLGDQARAERLVAALREPRFPPLFDHFRVEWERAAWSNAGQPAAEVRAKYDLLRWRLYALLADLSGDLVYYHEAALARPDVAPTRAALGCALARAGRPAAAVAHLLQAVAQDPFDCSAARACYQALGDSGNRNGQRRLARERRVLCRAAPEVVAEEAWFAEAPPAAAGREASQPSLRVVWEGRQLAVESLALVNREICLRLLARGHDLSLRSPEPRPTAPPAHPALRLLVDHLDKPLRQAAEVHVGMQWPPRLQPPASGHWVILQPWEYGSLPRAWLEPLTNQVDEVWAPSTFVRDCFVAGGIPAEQVHVVHLGIDPLRFHPGARPLPLRTRKRFRFLFVGGTIQRKGIDLLLEAYAQTFRRSDDVCLVIKDMGVDTFYRGQTARERILRYQQRDEGPEIEYLDQTLTEAELAGLYTACDCLVHPYRGEGFGLPILEAMASGLPVIVTGHGAALDICAPERAYLIPAQVVPFPEKRVGELETVDFPWLVEPDRAVLQQHLRAVLEHPEEARRRSEAARVHVCSRFTWDDTVALVEGRLEGLRGRPLRRQPARAAAVTVPADTGRCRVSLCLIVKNEEANLPACLTSAAGLCDEIIVVDTGSTDATREMAVRAGAQVFEFPWVDSFAAARNECLRHATGDWIFWLDADDRLDEDNRCKLRELFAGLRPENVAYSMKCLCLPDPRTGTATVVDHVRLFRRHPELLWEYRVHEQILPAVRRLGGEVRWCDVVIQHTGYQDAALRRRKLDRDLRLLTLDHTERPDEPFILFNLGQVYHELGRTAEALPLLQRSLERSRPQDSIVRKLFALIVQCHRELGQKEKAQAACQAGRGHYPDDVELLYLEGMLRRAQGDAAAAEDCWLRLLTSREGAHFASVDAELRGCKVRHNLAALYREQRRPSEAERQWRAALDEQPAFLPAWLGLGELYLEQQRDADLEEVIGHLEARPDWEVEGGVLQARRHQSRHEFTAARQILERIIERAPSSLWPRVILTHVLLQEGKDWLAAEKALRAVLDLDPKHVEARRNLDLLLQQHGRAQ